MKRQTERSDRDVKPFDVRDRLIGADHETLRRMTGFLVVSGLHKLEPTLAALRGGYVDHMVLDVALAEAVLAAA